jgi:hypothetical protein
LQRLCLGILDDALTCLRVGGTHGGSLVRARDQREAWEWVLSDADSCLSFTTVCGVLHLNAGAVRRQLLRYRVADETIETGVFRLKKRQGRP